MRKTLTIIVAADIDSFIGVDSDGSYYVLTLDDDRDIELNDRLEGRFDGEGSLFYSVKNLTQREDVKICLEDWECSLTSAIATILAFAKQNKAVVFAGNERIELPCPDPASQILNAVLANE